MGRYANDWLATAPGAGDFAEVYRAVRHDIRSTTLMTMLTTPGFARFVELAANSDPEAAYAKHWAGIEAALAGDWSVHDAAVRVMAPLCANLGVSLDDWQHLMDSTGIVLRDALFARFGAEPGRLKDAVALMHRFYDVAFGTFVAAYHAATVEQLQQSEALFQLTTIGHVLLDETGALVKANDAFHAMYGIPRGQLHTRTLPTLFEPAEFERIRRSVYPAAAESGRASYDTVHVRGDGSPFPARVESVRIGTTLGGTRLWGLSVYDLTERMQVEVLRARGVELEAENERVREANRVKSEFLANMSHELRTPLNAILGFSELLEGGDVGPLAPQQLDFVHDIHSSGKHLLRLINDVLDLSKVEAGKLDFYPEELDLVEVTRHAVHVSRAAAAERSIHVDVEIDETTRHVRLDPARYQQVLYNYLSNAIKFSPAGGRVRIVIAPDVHGTFRLSVTDHGAGIAKDDLDRLFVLFEQLDAGRAKKHAGTGLGLALTKRLVQAQGGLVGVDSTVGRGSTFFAVLPLRAVGSSPLPEPRQILGAAANAPRVLVIEDDPNDQDRIVNALVAAGYAVDTAATGAQAMRALHEQRFDAITLDLLLPDTHGIALLQEIRSVPGLERVPVVVISIVSEQASSGLMVSAALQKPFQPEQLVAALTGLSIGGTQRAPILVVEDDQASARLMAQSLGQLGFRAVLAFDGAHALELAKAERPLAVVLDLALPTLDGFEFLHRFRNDLHAHDVPVLVWSVKDLSREEREELLRSAQAVIPKDGTGMRNLLDTLRTYLGQRPSTAPPPLT